MTTENTRTDKEAELLRTERDKKYSLELEVHDLTAELDKARELLRVCSEKLLLYYKATDGNYVGGREHQGLQDEIDELLNGSE